MAGKVNNKMSVVVACLVALIQISSSLAAQSLTVGDGSGWTNSGVNYATWASDKTFAVGDTLVFTFTSGSHSVTEVSKSEYDACTFNSPISSSTTSPTNIVLTSGTHYYICTFGSHCSQGQKLAVTVGSSSTPSTTPAPTPSSSTTTESPPPPSATTGTPSPPPPPSSSPAVVTGFVMPFLIAAAAFFF